MIALLACLSVVLTIPPTREISFDRLILAIEEVENGRWDLPGGKANWKKMTWMQYSALPYAQSGKRIHSREAMLHLFADYTRRYCAEGLTPTHWLLATAWFKGYEGAKKVRRTANDYGERVANLTEEKR